MHQIRYFLAVAEHLNFTRAAEACHVAQPSLTRAIKKLEEELGGELFRRERRATHVTDLGRMMLPLLAQSYTVAHSAKDLAGSYASGGIAPLTLIVSRAVDLTPFLPALAEIVRVFPGLQLQLDRGSATDVLDRLKAGDAELGIAGQLTEDWERLDTWQLFTESARLYAHRTNPLTRRRRIRAEDLDATCWLNRPYCPESVRWIAALEDLGASLPSRFEMADDSDVRGFIDRNLGISLLPDSTSRPDSLSPIVVDGLDAERTVSLYGVAGRQRSKAATSFMKLLRAADLLG